MNPRIELQQHCTRLLTSIYQHVNRLYDDVPQDKIDERDPESILAIREEFLELFFTEKDFIPSFVASNPGGLSKPDLEIVSEWEHAIDGTFCIMEQQGDDFLLLWEASPVVFKVKGINPELFSHPGFALPVVVETVLLPYRDEIFTDGVISRVPEAEIQGMEKIIENEYRDALEKHGVVESLPVPEELRTELDSSRIRFEDLNPDERRIAEPVIELTNRFCEQHLDEEYQDLCRELACELAKLQPSPLRKGLPKSWASGILRTIGKASWLDEKSFEPCMKLAEIDDALGVGHSTAQAKAREIRTLMDIHRYEFNWCVPSALEHNPYLMMAKTISLLRESADLISESEESGLTDEVYQFRITLADTNPPVWRTIQVRDCTLDEFHRHIQTAMGWTNSHMHEFKIKGQSYAPPSPFAFEFEKQLHDSTQVNLSDMISPQARTLKFDYTYDFGDNWEHEIRFETRLQPESGKEYPRCLAGERACPPEDVGGVWGYYDLIDALQDPQTERHQELLEWCPNFKPDRFDANSATRNMRQGLVQPF